MAYIPNTVGEEQWNDYMTAVLINPAGVTAPTPVAFTPVTGLFLPGFIGTGVKINEIFCTIEVLHEYAEGSDFHPHIHWCPDTNGTGNVKWYIDFSVTNNNSTFSTQVTSSVTVAAGGTPWVHKITEFDDVISGAGINIGALICFRIWRDPADVNDTYTGNAILMSVGVHTLMNSLGSRQETVK